MSERLKNKIAVVTGGNSGIGLATAKLFAAEGAKVAITGRNATTIETAVAEIGLGAIGIASNVSVIANIDKQFAEIHSQFGNIDVLVINAGIFLGGSVEDYTEEQFDQTSDINFKGVFFTLQRALPYLNDGASIVLTSSALNEKGVGSTAAYSATKAAVRSLARSFSEALLGRKIRVNILSPGAIDTPIFGRTGGTKEQVDASKAFFAEHNPTKRLGNVDEIAKGFLYLASDDSQFMVGAELVLDGGVKAL